MLHKCLNMKLNFCGLLWNNLQLLWLFLIHSRSAQCQTKTDRMYKYRINQDVSDNLWCGFTVLDVNFDVCLNEEVNFLFVKPSRRRICLLSGSMPALETSALLFKNYATCSFWSNL